MWSVLWTLLGLAAFYVAGAVVFFSLCTAIVCWKYPKDPWAETAMAAFAASLVWPGVVLSMLADRDR